VTALAWLVALGLVGTAGYVLVRRESDDRTPQSPEKVGKFLGQLRKSQLYRVYSRVSPELSASYQNVPDRINALSQEIARRVESSGFRPVMLVTQDPSDNSVWTLIARWSHDSSEVFEPSGVSYFLAEPVEEPPAQLTQPQPEPPPGLDMGLTFDEQNAIQYALAKDDDPKHLSGFASTLSPDFPVSVSLLLAKARLAELRMMQTTISGAAPTVRRRVREGFRRAYAHAGWHVPETVTVGGFDPLGWIEEQASDALDWLKRATEDMRREISDAWDRYGGIIETLGGQIPGPQIWMAETAIKLAKAINEGRPIANALGEVASEQQMRFAKGLRQTSPFIAFIPGLGQGVAMMINAATAIAMAQPLDDALLETIAAGIPGGPIAQKGFLIAAQFGNSALRGEPFDAALANAARSAMPEELRPAFDAGLALARGKTLQEAGFQALYNLVRGNDLAERGVRFTEALVQAKQTGRSVKDVLIDQLSRDLEKLPFPKVQAIVEAKKVIAEIQKNGELLKMFPQELAQRLGVPTEIAAVALAAVSELPGQIKVVDEQVLKALDPIGSSTRITVPNAAVQLEYAAGRPVLSNVVKVPVAQAKLHTIAQVAANAPSEIKKLASQIPANQVSQVVTSLNLPEQTQDLIAAVKAKEQLDRAAKLLQRQKWIDWYKRQEALALQSRLQGVQTLTGRA
jgi:hypothetical protein